MFSQRSRYRHLPESTPLNAEGERLRGKDVRRISLTSGRFLHTVREGDRLDLLAFKFYGDATKWWQIADANPEPAFPTELLDQRPLVEEQLLLTHPDFEARFEALQIGLSNSGVVRRIGNTIFVASAQGLLAALSEEGELESTRPDFLESVVAVIYEALPVTRQQILAEIQSRGFHFLRAFAWTIETHTAEAFSFDDSEVKSSWQMLVDSLDAMPGVLQVQSVLAEAALHVVYNSAMVRRGALLSQIQAVGFALMPESATFSRIGAKIIVPPNQIV